jgi:hypothetical protein
MTDVGEIITTIAIFGLTQLGLLLFLLGAIRATLQDHGRRIENVECETKKHADEIGILKGEMRA